MFSGWLLCLLGGLSPVVDVLLRCFNTRFLPEIKAELPLILGLRGCRPEQVRTSFLGIMLRFVFLQV